MTLDFSAELLEVFGGHGSRAGLDVPGEYSDLSLHRQEASPLVAEDLPQAGTGRVGGHGRPLGQQKVLAAGAQDGEFLVGEDL